MAMIHLIIKYGGVVRDDLGCKYHGIILGAFNKFPDFFCTGI